MNRQKVAIVTGGGSGLGLAIARKLAESNIRTIIIGRDKAKLDAAVKNIGNGVEAISFDLTDLKKIPVLVQDVIHKYGSVDILVNNAGINQKKNALEVTDSDFQHILLTNLNSVFALTREAAKGMTASGSGSIINISSMASQYGIPAVVSYTASKSAIEGITKSLAVELSPFGVRVNCVAPGFIETEMSAKALNGDPERRRKVLSRTPMGRLGQPEDVARAVYFLASDEANFITGSILRVDGGNAIGF
ncbi:MAG: SDR family oxidoreductase [Cyclobacteriaceae bacterium]|nr:SDR family oxidoreductase [Cyclobacteriaceae bacterium]